LKQFKKNMSINSLFSQVTYSVGAEINAIMNLKIFLLKDKPLSELTEITQLIMDNSDKYEKIANFPFFPLLGDYSSFIRQNARKKHDAFENLAIQLKAYIREHCDEQILEKKQYISTLYSEEFVTQVLVKESLKLTTEKTLKDLPLVAKEILEKIKLDYITLYNGVNELNAEDKFMVSNLWTNHIPRTINTYLRIEKKDRLELKNSEGKNVEQLMIDSLHNISVALINIKEKHNQNNISEMSSINRYTKKII
jgi:hypothetical protein